MALHLEPPTTRISIPVVVGKIQRCRANLGRRGAGEAGPNIEDIYFFPDLA